MFGSRKLIVLSMVLVVMMATVDGYFHDDSYSEEDSSADDDLVRYMSLCYRVLSCFVDVSLLHFTRKIKLHK